MIFISILFAHLFLFVVWFQLPNISNWHVGPAWLKPTKCNHKFTNGARRPDENDRHTFTHAHICVAHSFDSSIWPSAVRFVNVDQTNENEFSCGAQHRRDEKQKCIVTNKKKKSIQCVLHTHYPDYTQYTWPGDCDVSFFFVRAYCLRRPSRLSLEKATRINTHGGLSSAFMNEKYL